MKSFIFGTWNVRTLLDNAQANRPERRTALVGRELARYKVDIAALSETRLAEEGQLKETGAGFTFFWSGRAKDDRREAGVGFAVKEWACEQTEQPPPRYQRQNNDHETDTHRKQTGHNHQRLRTYHDQPRPYKGPVLWRTQFPCDSCAKNWKVDHSRRLQCPSRCGSPVLGERPRKKWHW